MIICSDERGSGVSPFQSYSSARTTARGESWGLTPSPWRRQRSQPHMLTALAQGSTSSMLGSKRQPWPFGSIGPSIRQV